MSLYRKYRPQKFIDLVGQEHVKTTLSNALKTGKFSHAYLFAGPKGSGKTSTARLLAKALNCTGRALSNDEIEPCEKCVSCREIIGGHSIDMVEIDAASNRGIDEIRELRDKIRFAPTAGRYKIYIIDECHMLTKEAFNALLKTLEEPPAHAVFILATTELHKVPATILSRVQVFDFKKAKIEDIVLKLKKIIKAEKLAIEEEALYLIARLAYGAFRDAETMLDQVANLGQDQKITLEQVQLVLGQSTEKSVWELAEALAGRQRVQALKIVADVYFEGKNLENFIAQLVEIFRKVILLQAGLEILDASKEETERITQISQNFTAEELVSAIEKLVEAMPKVKTLVLGQLPLEMVVFELTAQKEIRNEKLEIREEKSIETKEIQEAPKSRPIIQKPKPQIKEEIIKKDTNNFITNNSITSDLSSVWLDVVKYAKTHNNGLAAMLKDANIKNIEGDKIILGVKFKFHADQICSSKNRKVIEEAFQKHASKSYQIDCIVDPAVKIKKPVDSDEELLDSAKEVFDL